MLLQNSMTKYSPVEVKPPPKSGMRRLFSYDSRFFIRCIQSEQVAEMHRFLKEYHQVPSAMKPSICHAFNIAKFS